jgi:hypothetical protein
MTKLTLSARLVLLLALPLAGVVAFGLHGAWDKWSTRQNFARIRTSGAALRQLGEVVHELQRERGRAAVFVGSHGAKFAAEWPEQQHRTDAAIAKFQALRAALDEHALGNDAAALHEAMAALDQLAAKRSAAAAFSITAAESSTYFTNTIAAQLDVIVAMSHAIGDARVGNAIDCYVSFLQMKEQVGIERAVLAGVFSADKFTGDAFQRFNHATAAQETYGRVFHDFATPEQESLVPQIVRGTAVDQAAAMRKTALERAATGGFNVDSAAWFDAITAKIELMKQVEDRLAADYTAVAAMIEHEAQTSFVIYTAATCFILALAAGGGVWVIRSISGPLRHVIDELAATAEQTSSASGQVSASSQSLAAGSSEQAARLEETSAALAEMAAMTKRNAENAQQAKEFSSQTRASADAGARHVEEMRVAMDAIKASSDGISKIIKTIDEIAFQTNILALNAAVEAARAGEAGMGFAVVAEEVRGLAQRSANSAKETADKIEDAIRRSEHGVQISGSVARALSEIVEKARHVDTFVAEIAEASSQQNRAAEQVNEAVAKIDQITQANAGNAEETASAAEELNAQAKSLQDSVVALGQLIGREIHHEPERHVAPVAPAPTAFDRRRELHLPSPVPKRRSSAQISSGPAPVFSLKPASEMAEVSSNV